MSWRTLLIGPVAVVVLTGVLALWRNDILFERPYWSAALGVFTQAQAVVDSTVDAGPTPAPALYRSSFVPWIVAGCVQTFGAGNESILAFRLITFAFAAFTLLVIVEWLRGPLGISCACLTAAAIVTTPLFTVQVEQLGTEIPTAALVILSAFLLSRGHYMFSAIAGLGAFFAQWTGIVFLLAAFVYSLARGFAGGRLAVGAWRSVLWQLAGLGIAGGVMLLHRHDGLPMGGWVPSFEFGTSPIFDLWKWCPDLVGLLAIVFMLVVAIGRPEAADNTKVQVGYWDFPIAFSGILVLTAGTVFAITGAVPGNLAFVVPFVVMAWAWSILVIPAWRGLGMFLMYGLIAFNLINSEGILFPAIAPPNGLDWRTGSIRERSREYLKDDQARNIEMVRVLLEKGRGKKIAAPPPLVQMLSLPALGYVTEPFEGYTLGNSGTGKFPSIEKIRTDEPGELVIVYVANRYGVGHEWIVPQPERGDVILYPDTKEVKESPGFIRSPLFVYSPRVVPSETADRTRDRYIRRFWPSEQMLPRARQLVELGQLRDAEIILRQILTTNEANHAARLQLGLLLVKDGKVDISVEEFAKIPTTAPEYWLALSQTADIKLNQKKYQEADADYARILAEYEKRSNNDPRELAMLYFKRALTDVPRSEWKSAREKLAKAVEIDAGFALGYRELGFALAQLGEMDESRRQLELGLDLDRNDALAHLYLAATLSSQGEWEYARAEFEEALRLAPENAEAQEGLGVALTRLKDFEASIKVYDNALSNTTDPARRSRLLLGLADAQRGAKKWEEAINSVRRAASIDPESMEAANQVAWMLATAPREEWRNAVEALEAGEKAGKREDAPSVHLDTLAAVYADAGRWEDAVSTAEKAIAKAKSEGKEILADEFSKRLELYRQKKPYYQDE